MCIVSLFSIFVFMFGEAVADMRCEPRARVQSAEDLVLTVPKLNRNKSHLTGCNMVNSAQWSTVPHDTWNCTGLDQHPP